LAPKIAVCGSSERKEMSLEDELKEIQDKIERLIDGNFVLKANVIKIDVQSLRAKVMRDDPGDKLHIIPVLDGIDKDLNALIERHTRNPNPK
jgi:hypothetical protein